MSDPKNIVEKTFWEEEYFAGISLPCRPDFDLPFDRCLANALVERAPVPPAAHVLEVGCAPARWLLFYEERFGAKVEGVEYSAKGAALSRKNLEQARVEGTIHQADFFAMDAHAFELVLSLGFIEHFDDVDAAFDRHVQFVAPGGRLVIGVPNYRGLNRFIQWLADPGHLQLHNLQAMKPSLYRRLAGNHALDLEHIDYLGGADPIIIKLGRRGATLLTMLLGRYRRLGFADRINHRWISSYLLLTFHRPERAPTSPTSNCR
jgi:SAM-dependent methyltransferase